jgi:hypothetical protein
MFLRNTGNQLQHNTIYNVEEHIINTHRRENLKWIMDIYDIKFLNGVRIHKMLCNRWTRNVHPRRCFMFKSIWIYIRCKSLDTGGNKLNTEHKAIFAPFCIVILLKWWSEVLTAITMKIPALWNVKSCSLMDWRVAIFVRICEITSEQRSVSTTAVVAWTYLSNWCLFIIVW